MVDAEVEVEMEGRSDLQSSTTVVDLRTRTCNIHTYIDINKQQSLAQRDLPLASGDHILDMLRGSASSHR